MVLSSCFFFVIVFLLWKISATCSRKATTMLALFSSSVFCAAFTWAGGHTSAPSWLVKAAFHFGYFGNTASSTLGYMVLYQIAVEIYPTSAAASGGAFII